MSIQEQVENRDKELYPSIWTPVTLDVPLTQPDINVNLQEIAMDGQELKTGEKKDEGKAKVELLPFDVLEAIARILTNGAKKYDSRNWERGIAYGRVYGAALRHLFKFWNAHINGSTGINSDDGTESHLDHAITELMFLSAYEKRGMTKFDDRPNIKQDIRQG